MTPRIPLLVAVAIGGSVQSAFACFAAGQHPNALVKNSDVIVRVRALAVTDAPTPSSILLGVTSLVHLGVLEQLKGETLFSLTVTGTLSDRADMNDKPVPYVVVRGGGLGGGCHAYNYQHGGEYLLLLKKVDGKLTPYWAPRGATNEQINGEHDPWVAWVRRQLGSIRLKG